MVFVKKKSKKPIVINSDGRCIHENNKLLNDNDITVNLIENELNKLIDEIHKRNKSNFIDINQIVELCFANILNVLYGWELQMCVNSREKCIDASDDKNKIWLQITSNNSIEKIKKTLKGYYSLKKHQDYRFIYFILGNMKNYRNNGQNQDIKSFLDKSVLDKNWLLGELKKRERDKEKLSKIYDYLLKVFDDIGVSRDRIIEGYDDSVIVQHTLGNRLFLQDEIFDISLSLGTSKNIFEDNNIIVRHKGSIIYIMEEKLITNYFVSREEFIERNVHFINDNKAYLDMITTSLVLDTHVISKIFNMFKQLQIEYENNVKKNLEAIGLIDKKFICKKHKKVIMGKIFKWQWDCIVKYADRHKHDWSDNSENIFCIANDNSSSILLSGAQAKEYKGIYLATISVDKAMSNYKDDACIDIMWEPGERKYNIDYVVFDNVNCWKVDFTKKYIEDKILMTKMFEINGTK